MRMARERDVADLDANARAIATAGVTLPARSTAPTSSVTTPGGSSCAVRRDPSRAPRPSSHGSGCGSPAARSRRRGRAPARSGRTGSTPSRRGGRRRARTASGSDVASSTCGAFVSSEMRFGSRIVRCWRSRWISTRYVPSGARFPKSVRPSQRKMLRPARQRLAGDERAQQVEVRVENAHRDDVPLAELDADVRLPLGAAAGRREHRGDTRPADRALDELQPLCDRERRGRCYKEPDQGRSRQNSLQSSSDSMLAA